MKYSDWIARLEAIAPPSTAEEWDNVGLIIGTERAEVSRVLVALDCTVPVAKEAVTGQYDMVLTHHPLLFHPVQRLLPDRPETAAAYLLIRNGIGLYAAHTNLDRALGGVNDALCAALGLCDPMPFGDGMGRMGSLTEAVPLGTFVRRVEQSLDTHAQFVGAPDTPVCRVAVLGGAGISAAADAKAADADVLVTGELSHHEAHNLAVLGMPCIAAGHYETERVVLQPWIGRLQTGQNDVLYRLAYADASPYTRRLEE